MAVANVDFMVMQVISLAISQVKRVNTTLILFPVTQRRP